MQRSVASSAAQTLARSDSDSIRPVRQAVWIRLAVRSRSCALQYPIRVPSLANPIRADRAADRRQRYVLTRCERATERAGSGRARSVAAQPNTYCAQRLIIKVFINDTADLPVDL